MTSTDPRARVVAARRARRRQIKRLRLAVAAAAVTIFIAAWAGIGVRMAAGKDPALSAASKPAVTQAADRSNASRGARSASPAAVVTSPAPVVTRQS
jgi:hypothetical protein